MKAKINWADAPYWAQYWAMDADGSAYWYESCPHYDIDVEVWTPHIKVSMESNEIEETDCAPADAYGFNPVDCKNSKTERPSAYDKVQSKESKSYAVKLAESLEGEAGKDCYCEALASIECACPDVSWPEEFTEDAANELRRLQEENENLRDALSKYATDEEPWGWDAIDALSSAGTDEYVEDKVMSDKIIFAEESMTTKVTRKDGKIIVRANSGYSQGVNKLCTVKDTGNGFIVKFHSQSSITQPDYHSIDYSHAAYLFMALLVEHNVGDTFGKIDIVDQDQNKDCGLDNLSNA
jgi:hypothetical protein